MDAPHGSVLFSCFVMHVWHARLAAAHSPAAVDENGKMSRHIHSMKVGLPPHGPAARACAARAHLYARGILQVGDTIDVKGPFTKKVVGTSDYRQIGMIAGGTGITPLKQVRRWKACVHQRLFVLMNCVRLRAGD